MKKIKVLIRGSAFRMLGDWWVGIFGLEMQQTQRIILPLLKKHE